MQLLQQRATRADPDPMASRLPDMAVRLEKYLWEERNGDVIAYSDVTTLKPRLQVLAIEMSQQINRMHMHHADGHTSSGQPTSVHQSVQVMNAF